MRQASQPADYYRPQRFAASLRGRQVEFISKPGLPSWERVTPASVLLAESVEAAPDARILLLGGGHGALAVALAALAPAGSLALTDTSTIALDMAEQTLRHNQVAGTTILRDLAAPPAPATYDVVVLEQPRGRALSRRWLLQSYLALRPGGRLYLAGAGDEGIEPAIADARQLFGSAVVLAYKQGSRVAVATRPERPGPDAVPGDLPAWAAEPGIAPGTWHTVRVELLGQSVELKSLPGVFAYDRLDEGTALLLHTLPSLQGARVLDLGCGYGPIGLALASQGAAHVDLVDANLLAVACARANIADLGLTNARAFPSDALAAVAGPYDAVVTNPPFHAGKAVTFDITETFIAGSRRLLSPGGTLILVANSFIRYERGMRELFQHVETLAANGKFHVLRATK